MTMVKIAAPITGGLPLKAAPIMALGAKPPGMPNIGGHAVSGNTGVSGVLPFNQRTPREVEAIKAKILANRESPRSIAPMPPVAGRAAAVRETLSAAPAAAPVAPAEVAAPAAAPVAEGQPAANNYSKWINPYTVGGGVAALSLASGRGLGRSLAYGAGAGALTHGIRAYQSRAQPEADFLGDGNKTSVASMTRPVAPGVAGGPGMVPLTRKPAGMANAKPRV